jgi:desulfoferrodoxin-like iron-binding protein
MKNSYVLKSLTAVVLCSFILSLQNCKNSGNSTSKADSVKIDVKSADKALFPESLITNKDTMKMKDPAKPTDFELKHTPDIAVAPTDANGISAIKVTVGLKGITHPEVADHWIYFIELRIDGKVIEHRLFANNADAGKAEFKVNIAKAKKIKVWIGCNKHGIWGNEMVLGK